MVVVLVVLVRVDEELLVVAVDFVDEDEEDALDLGASLSLDGVVLAAFLFPGFSQITANLPQSQLFAVCPLEQLPL